MSISIPTVKECFMLIHQMQMFDHIRRHSVMVARVALFITEHLLNQHYQINRKLVYASALLHDITKTRSFDTGELHAQTGGEYLSDIGYPEVGNLVRQHVLLDDYNFAHGPTEAQKYNYSDKRVLHEDIVTLDKRIDYIYNVYGTSPDRKRRILKGGERIREVEEKLFESLNITPQNIADFLQY